MKWAKFLKKQNFIQPTKLTTGSVGLVVQSQGLVHSSRDTLYLTLLGLLHAACWSLGFFGQSEPAPTSAPVGRSVHGMGCISSSGS